MDEKEHPIENWLHVGELGKLVAHIEKINTLNAVMQRLLPATFREGCQVENVTQGCVMLAVNTPALMTLLRYEIPSLLAALRKESQWAGIASIKCHVRVT